MEAAQGSLETEKDYRSALSRLRYIAENKFAQQLRAALGAYVAANQDHFPTDLSQLQPYFASPADPDMLQRWEIAPQDRVPNVACGTEQIITQKGPVDPELDSCLVVCPNGSGTTIFRTLAKARENPPDLQVQDPVLSAYRTANNGKNPTVSAQLEPHLTTPQQEAAFQRVFQSAPDPQAKGKEQ